MAIGPVQLIVLGFNHPDFHRVRSSPNLNGSMRAARCVSSTRWPFTRTPTANWRWSTSATSARPEAIEVGTKIGALIGLGHRG